MPAPRMLGVLLCYNDGDVLEDAIRHLLSNNHQVIAWNHGSTDETADVLRRWRRELLEVTDVSRDVDFYDMYPLLSKHLMSHYVRDFDWISWPDQDELLEGPTREKPYHCFVRDVMDSPHSYVEFEDFVYWHTDQDDPAVSSPMQRVRHYSLARHGPQKIRAWKAPATNIRWFNHNRTEGTRYPTLFNLRHYPMRSEQQMWRRISIDRAGIQHGPVNFHYENMKRTLAERRIGAEELHRDDGGSLDPRMKFDWSGVYGTVPDLPASVVQTYFLATKSWEAAAVLKRGLVAMSPADLSRCGRGRVERWIEALEQKIHACIVITFERGAVRVVTLDLARKSRVEEQETGTAGPVVRADTALGDLSITVVADADSRSVHVSAKRPSNSLLALVPCYGGDKTRVAALLDGKAVFEGLRTMYYFLTCAPEAA